MKIFVDTNIFLDLLLERANYEDALVILNSVEANLFEGVVLDITLLNIDYVARKQIKDIRAFLRLVNDMFEVVGANNKSVLEALHLTNSDLEDNLQYICAKESAAECIISNDKEFLQVDVEVYSSSDFVKKYIA